MASRDDGPGSVRPMEVVSPPAAEDPTWQRLEDQLGWYDRKSGDNQRWYKRLKLLELAVAAALRWWRAREPGVGHRRPGRGDRCAGGRPAPVPVPGALDHLLLRLDDRR